MNPTYFKNVFLNKMSCEMNYHNLNNKRIDNTLLLSNGLELDFTTDVAAEERYNYSSRENNCYIFLNTNKSKAEIEVVHHFETIYLNRIIKSIGIKIFQENSYYMMWENNLDFGIESKRDLFINHFKLKYDGQINKFVFFNDFVNNGFFSKNKNIRINFIFNNDLIQVEVILSNSNKINIIHKNIINENTTDLSEWMEYTMLPYGLTKEGAEIINLNDIKDYEKEHYQLYKILNY